MSLSRRALFLGETRSAVNVEPPTPSSQNDVIRLSNNENPLGPFPDSMAALRSGFAGAGRYPMNVTPSMADLMAALAERIGCSTDNLVFGAGSGELLQTVAHAFTGPDRHLVSASPTYAQTGGVARANGAEVKAIPVTADGMLDLDAMAEASRGAGLVFCCNPNNPTGTVHGADAVRRFVEMVARISPDTVIHMDEAYHEYVTDPAYESAVDMALEQENVFVSRTFSKCFGMAGMRVGYGIGSGRTIERLQELALTVNIAVPTLAGAYQALQDPRQEVREKRRNTQARQYTIDFLEDLGYDVMPSQTNFIFVNIGRPAAGFRAACRERGFNVGRNFPPMEQTHARISIGTLEQMQGACAVFKEVLA